MTRRNIGIEGKTTTDGRLISNGAITCEDEQIPVMRVVPPDEGDYNYNREVAGYATDFQRAEDGTLSMELTVPGLTLEAVNVHMELDGAETIDPLAEEERNLVFTKARLRGLFLSTQRSAWPELNVVDLSTGD